MSTTIERLSAELAARYRIERELGAGGMATVYLAEDLKHKRKVALKVLKPELAAVLGADRFVQEITTTAALQHPHILPLFDSGEAGGFLFYVMPFIDGETLRSKLDRETQLGVDESLRIACDVSDALHYAHTHGVIHRDIKPENILLHNGRPMVADFGIALALSVAAGGRMTETGLSLGTPHYMSPEQATAEKDISARSDIYSLASVLYEMLAGQPPHLGGSAQQIIMKIITEAPRPVTDLRKSVPVHVAAALDTALEKLPADRFATANAFAAALQGLGPTGVGRGPRHAGAVGWLRDPRSRVALVAITALAVLAGISRGSRRERVTADEPVMARLAFAAGDRIADTQDDDVTNAGRPSRTAFAISPNDSKLVFVGERDGQRQLFVRSLSGETAIPMAGTFNAESPFFSPDGAFVAYWANGALMRVPMSGGEPTQIAEMTRIRGGDWHDEQIVVGDDASGLILLASSGTAKSDTLAGRGATMPKFLPGGKAIVFSQRVGIGQNKRNLEVITIANRKRKLLLDNASDGRFLESGHIVFARDGRMLVVPFDVRALKVTARPVVVLNDVMQSLNGTNTNVQTGAMQAVISTTGHLLYLTGGVTPDRARQLVWLDRQGNASPITAAGVHPFFAVRLSPDETRVAVTTVGWRDVLHVFDLKRGAGQSLADPGLQLWPLWSPDGRRIVRNGVMRDSSSLVWSLADGSRPAEPILKDKVVDGGAAFWSRDASELFVRGGPPGARHLLAVHLGTGATRTIANLPNDIEYPTLSPDGRWLAYAAHEAGQLELYVQPWPTLDRKWKVSSGGGSVPKWTRDGRELLYGIYAGTDSAGRSLMRIMAAQVEPGPDFSTQPPRELFTAPFGTSTGIRSFDVTADGSRFLVVMGKPMQSPPGELRLIANWTTELQRLSTQGTP